MKSFKLIPVFLLILNVDLMGAALLTESRAGLVSDVGGKVVQLKNEREDKLLPLNVDDDLFFNDAVVTGDASNAGLLLSPDDKKIHFFIYENSKLKIDPVLVREGKKSFAAKISKGMIRVLTQKLKGDTVTITAPNLTAGIRGTNVSVSTDKRRDQGAEKFETTVENQRMTGAASSPEAPCVAPTLGGEEEGGKGGEPVIVTFTPDQKKPTEKELVALVPGEAVTIVTDISSGRSSALEKAVATEAIPTLIASRRERCGEVALPQTVEPNAIAMEELINDFAILGLIRCGG